MEHSVQHIPIVKKPTTRSRNWKHYCISIAGILHQIQFFPCKDGKINVRSSRLLPWAPQSSALRALRCTSCSMAITTMPQEAKSRRNWVYISQEPQILERWSKGRRAQPTDMEIACTYVHIYLYIYIYIYLFVYYLFCYFVIYIYVYTYIHIYKYTHIL